MDKLYINRYHGNDVSVVAIAEDADEAEAIQQVYAKRSDGADYYIENKPARWDVETSNIFGGAA